MTKKKPATQLRPEITALIAEIEAYCTRTGLKESTFGQYAATDKDFVERIRNGGRMWPETIAKVRAWMVANPNRKGRE